MAEIKGGIMIVVIVILVVVGFVFFILKTGNNQSIDNKFKYEISQAKYNKEDWREVLGTMLGIFIKTFPKDKTADLLKTRQEELEMYYLLAMEGTYWVNLNYKENDAEKILNIMYGHLFNSMRQIRTLYNRMSIYQVHKDLVGLGNNRAFVLSYFLNKARGKTSEKDMTDLLMGKRKITPADMSEVLDLEEMLKLNAILVGTSEGIIDIIKDFSL